MRLIDADALIPMMKYATTDSEIGVFPIKIGFDAIVKVINAQPTIERKTGKWIDMGDFVQCSACLGTRLKEVETVYGKAVWMKTAFCPMCGADMRTKETDYDYERAIEQLEHDILYEPTFNQDDGSM